PGARGRRRKGHRPRRLVRLAGRGRVRDPSRGGDVRGIDRGRVDRRGYAGGRSRARHARGRLRQVRGPELHRPPRPGRQGHLAPVRQGDLRGTLPPPVARRAPGRSRQAHFRRPADRGPGQLAPSREAIPPRGDGLGRDARRARAAALGLPEVRTRPRRTARGRRGPDGRPIVSYLVDGGMLSNFPVEVFDRTDGKAPRWPTFGVKLSAKRINMRMAKFDVTSTLGLARAMVGTMTSFHDQIHIDDPSVIARTIFVDTGHVKATDFDLDEATQDMLFEHGRHAATKLISSWNFERYA